MAGTGRQGCTGSPAEPCDPCFREEGERSPALALLPSELPAWLCPARLLEAWSWAVHPAPAKGGGGMGAGSASRGGASGWWGRGWPRFPAWLLLGRKEVTALLQPLGPALAGHSGPRGSGRPEVQPLGEQGPGPSLGRRGGDRPRAGWARPWDTLGEARGPGHPPSPSSPAEACAWTFPPSPHPRARHPTACGEGFSGPPRLTARGQPGLSDPEPWQ